MTTSEKQMEIYPFHKHEVPYEHRGDPVPGDDGDVVEVTTWHGFPTRARVCKARPRVENPWHEMPESFFDFANER